MHEKFCSRKFLRLRFKTVWNGQPEMAMGCFVASLCRSESHVGTADSTHDFDSRDIDGPWTIKIAMADWDLFWTVPTHLVRWFYPEEMVTIHMLDYRRVDHQNWWIRILLVGSDVVLPDLFRHKVVAYEEFKPPAAGTNSNTATILGVRASWFHTALGESWPLR